MPTLNKGEMNKMNYESKNDGLVRLLDLANSLGIVGQRKIITQKDFPPIKWIKLKDLYIDTKYQRLLNEKMIKDANSFDTSLFSPLRCYIRPDGKIAIADGQHEGCIAAIYTNNPEEMELQVQIFEHEEDATVDECVEIEATWFKEININRTAVSQVAQLRTDVAAGVKAALDIQDTLIELGVHVEKIGNPDGLAVKGYAKLLESENTYGLVETKEAIEYYHKLLTSTKSGNKWQVKSGKDITLQGAMIGGLAAVINLRNSLSKGTEKRAGLHNFIESQLITRNHSPKEMMNKTAGNAQATLIARRFLDVCKTSINFGLIEGSVIGEETLAKYGLGDPSVPRTSTKNNANNDEEIE